MSIDVTQFNQQMALFSISPGSTGCFQQPADSSSRVECKWITTHKKMLGEYVYFVCLKGNKKYHPTYRIFKSPDVCVDLKNPTLACLCFALRRLIEYFVCQMRFSEFWFIFMDHRVWIRFPPPSFLLSPSYSSVHQHPEEESLVKTILSSFNFFSF